MEVLTFHTCMKWVTPQSHVQKQFVDDKITAKHYIFTASEFRNCGM